jgi:DNA-binding NarL/FixJ family response regulator
MVERAFQAGATAYISKIDEAIELSKALEAAIIGKTYLGKIVSDCLHTEVTSRLPNRTLKLLHSLSDREFHIFRRIGAKQGASAIAQELSISIKTLETHQRRIKEKLNLSSGIQLHHAAESWIATVSREGIYSHSQER